MLLGHRRTPLLYLDTKLPLLFVKISVAEFRSKSALFIVTITLPIYRKTKVSQKRLCITMLWINVLHGFDTLKSLEISKCLQLL